MPENKQLDVKVKFGLRSFVTVVCILFAVLILVGVLTYVIPAGTYQYDQDGNVIPDSYTPIPEEENTTRLPVWRWITAPFEALFGKNQMLVIIVLLLVLGGTFKVLDNSGGLVSLVRILIERLYQRRYVAIWVITLVIMLLSAVFGLQEQLLILYPILAMMCMAMNWSKFTAISFILISSGVGFTTAITNPLTIGLASEFAGTTVVDGLWYRLIIFAVMYVVTSMFLTYLAKTDERNAKTQFDVASFTMSTPEQHKQDLYKAKLIVLLFGVALLGVIVSMSIPALRSLSMVIMAVAFIVGTVIVGRLLLGSFASLGKSFVGGMKDVAPSIAIIMIAFGITHIATCGNILHTIFYEFNKLVVQLSPYLAVLCLYALILIIEFFIPSASAKAALIIPMLTLAPIEGISKNVILLTYLFADGYTNVLFPTCGTLLVGLGLADVSFVQWFKKTILFQLVALAISVGFLMLAIAIKL